MTDVSLQDDWAIAIDRFLDFLSIVFSPRNPVVWIAGGLIGFHAVTNTLCYFNIYCPNSKDDDIAAMGCKEAKEKLRTCNTAGEQKDQLLGQRGTRIINLERRKKKLELTLEECLRDRLTSMLPGR